MGYNNNNTPSSTHLQQLRKHISFAHIQSYNYFLSDCLYNGINDIEHHYVDLTSSDGVSSSNNVSLEDNIKSIEFWLDNIQLGNPQHNNNTNNVIIKNENSGSRFSNRISGSSNNSNNNNI